MFGLAHAALEMRTVHGSLRIFSLEDLRPLCTRMLPVSRVTLRIDSNVVLQRALQGTADGFSLEPCDCSCVSALVAGTGPVDITHDYGAMLEANVGDGREQARFGRCSQVNQSGSRRTTMTSLGNLSHLTKTFAPPAVRCW